MDTLYKCRRILARAGPQGRGARVRHSQAKQGAHAGRLAAPRPLFGLGQQGPRGDGLERRGPCHLGRRGRQAQQHAAGPKHRGEEGMTAVGAAVVVSKKKKK